MTIRGERLGDAPLRHNHERKAIRQTPSLIRTCPVKSDRSINQLRLKWHHLDVNIPVGSSISLYNDTTSGRVRKSIQPLPKDRFGSHDLAAGPDHEFMPFNSAGVILIASAR